MSPKYDALYFTFLVEVVTTHFLPTVPAEYSHLTYSLNPHLYHKMNLPTQEYRVVDFCTEAERLLEEAQITKINHKFINFVLTGVHDDRQAVVNPILNQIPAVDFDQLTINRDYDSLLGIDAQIHVQHPLTLYMMGKKEDILTSNIHLTHSWVRSLLFDRYDN